MKIINEFTVPAPIEVAWRVLTDLEGIATCLPGAQLTSVDGDVYAGRVTVKVGPVVSEFAGTARFSEKDDEAYRAVIDAKGRDARSAGNAAALIIAQLRAEGDSTVVTVDTDLKISGKLAQFGSGMIKEVSQKLLGQFVASLEARIAADHDGPPAGTPPHAGEIRPQTAEPQAAGPQVVERWAAGDLRGTRLEDRAAAAPAGEPAPLDLMALAGGSIGKRVIPVVIGAAVVVAAIVVWRVVR